MLFCLYALSFLVFVFIFYFFIFHFLFISSDVYNVFSWSLGSFSSIIPDISLSFYPASLWSIPASTASPSSPLSPGPLPLVTSSLMTHRDVAGQASFWPGEIRSATMLVASSASSCRAQTILLQPEGKNTSAVPVISKKFFSLLPWLTLAFFFQAFPARSYQVITPPPALVFCAPQRSPAPWANASCCRSRQPGFLPGFSELYHLLF